MSLSDKEKSRLRAFVSGRVQGVGFRWFVVESVKNLLPSLQGWVRNLHDGRVEVLAEGQTSELETLVDYLKRGPGHARVENVDTNWLDHEGDLRGFQVRY